MQMLAESRRVPAGARRPVKSHAFDEELERATAKARATGTAAPSE